MAMALDILSELPDGILSLILSKLPIRDAIKCSLLSKRWRFLYTEIPDLILSPYHLISASQLHCTLDTPLWSTIENRIFDILRVHSSDLNSFVLSIALADPWGFVSFSTPRRFTPENVSEWVRCVARKNVKRLSLHYSLQMETPPPALFSCSRLTVLTLKNCILATFPTDFAGFRHLTECTLRHSKMTDGSLARWVLHCPLLHKFNLMDCAGLRRPVISFPNLTDLVLQLDGSQQLTVNCPKLRTLKTNMCAKDLRLNGLEFCEISSTIENLQMELGGNLIELTLHSSFSREYNCSAHRFLELMGTLRSLKVLTIHLGNAYRGGDGITVPLVNLLSRLPNLERLHLRGKLILEEVEGDQILQCLTYPLVNLQYAEIEINKHYERQLGLLRCLLQIALALKQVILRPTGGRDKRRSFFETWGYLKKSREQGTLSEEIYDISFRF